MVTSPGGGDGETLLDSEVLPLYAQVEIGDRDNVDIPQWETGEELVVHNQMAVTIATRPDTEVISPKLRALVV